MAANYVAMFVHLASSFIPVLSIDRLPHGQEHTRRNWVGMPLARDIPLKMFPDQEHGNPMHGA